MLKNLSPTAKLFGGLILLVLLVMFIMMSVAGNKVPEQQNPNHYINDNASADNKVEALKTMTADLLAVENKNAQLEKTVEDIKTQNQQVVSQMKQSISTQIDQAVQQLQVQNQQKETDANTENKNDSYPVNGADDNDNSLTWVSDMSQNINDNATQNFSPNDSNEIHNSALPLSNKQIENLVNTANHLDDPKWKMHSHSLLHDEENSTFSKPQQENKKIIKPMYTIPVNATLTGATLMTPLVGRVPIDGKLPSPYSFKLVLSAENLTANGYPLVDVKGAVMSGVTSGDMLGSCARGDIKSITFIFNDGRISTSESQGDNDSLGYISSQTGNPCIDGKFHSNAGIFLGTQMGLAGAQGYANAIQNSQYMNSMSSEGGAVSALIGSADRAGIGAGGSAAAQAAQTWFNQRVQNSFDYVYVPNVDPATGKPMKVVVNISKEISIDYNNSSRKVDYEQDKNLLNSQLD